MAERPEDLNLPNSVIARIIKDALPAGVVVSKDTRVAISKAASVFVLYATSCANGFAMTNKRKTISGRDVLDAMDEMDFEKFIEPLKKSLEAYRQEQKNKKDSANKKKEQAAEKAEQGDGDGKENGSPEDDEEVMLIESESISDEEEEAEEEEAEAEEEEGDE